MYYGYDSSGDEEKDRRLAEKMSDFASSLHPDSRGLKTYVEYPGPYGGPAIRRITHYSEEDREMIVCECDKLHREIIGS
jgi:hypothetical protein